ncbi:hypothetical protein [Actinotalea subterranea]|uniref:hypothetical protein n=1 Tax=Actinotalea subterranea TaxID=2607497 RepID=UPI0011EE16BA|nr:hypothetical protein [Actinotalea subterranea]
MNHAARPPGRDRVSRTALPDGAPYRWEDYCAGVERVVENELWSCLEERCSSQAEYDLRTEEVAAVRARAAAGRLMAPEAEGATPVRVAPSLWELRWRWGSDQLRMYHAEPRRVADLLLALKVHWKCLDGPQARIDRLQESEMRSGQERFTRLPYFTHGED